MQVSSLLGDRQGFDRPPPSTPDTEGTKRPLLLTTKYFVSDFIKICAIYLCKLLKSCGQTCKIAMRPHKSEQMTFNSATMSVGNVHAFLISNPPLVLFTFTSVLFIIVLTTLAYYVKGSTTIHNPDVSRDWNMFLDNFAKLEFCVIQQNVTEGSDGFGSVVINRPHWWPPTWDQREARKQRIQSYSVMMSADIRPRKEFVSNLHNITHLQGSLPGKFIGIKGDSGAQKFNVSMVFPHQWSVDQCSKLGPLQECNTVSVEMCVEFRGARKLFPPETRPTPCHKEKHRGNEYWAGFNWQDVGSVSYCRSKTMININYKPVPALSKALKDKHRELSKSHLLYTSFLLTVFVTGVALYAVTVNHQHTPPLSPDYHKVDALIM